VLFLLRGDVMMAEEALGKLGAAEGRKTA